MTSPFWGSKVFSASHSNLECFLDRITPTVRAHFLPKSCLRDLNSPWHPVGKNTIEYFTLADLWDQFDEWSAYGLGVPIVLKGGETVVQFYVPYLSGIQIYTSKSFNSLRNPREECEVVEFESDSWSEDSESDKLSRSLSNNSSRTWDAVSEDSNFDQEGSWPMKDRLGSLYFQYFERLPPFLRVPVVYKINELAQNYPGLMTFRSVDLSPASWMAVAWYA
uniref:DUF789 domain-containing protein n=1 Tax=Nelumbo nucifera TaxID=4432 RepID=A0A822YNY8_NELNU|nr:TPA_asm: hypothetical protein HUJ06_011566 [Nelumbo nucifera]